jgi:cytochrome c biogenesis protein
MDTGAPQSVYLLDKTNTTLLENADGTMFRVDLALGDTVDLPNDAGSVTFEGLERWNKLQISQTPGRGITLGGVGLALIGLLGSLFIRPRRTWVRARSDGQGTLVEVAVLDRAGGDDVSTKLADLVAALQRPDVHSEETR